MSIELFRPAVQRWFGAAFGVPTRAQELGWPLIERGDHTLLLAPTGSGKTLAAFLSAINHVMFTPVSEQAEQCRVLYISPLKALAVDVERNLRAPLAGIAAAAHPGEVITSPTVAIRTGDTPSQDRARFAKTPTDILITTPESLYLLLTSNAREALRSIRWVIVDEIHAVVATKRGAHLALSLERLESIVHQPFQRIGLSATQRPLDEVARFLAGGEYSDGRWNQRPVQVVNAGQRKELDIQIMVPLEELTNEKVRAKPRGSWSSIYPEVLKLIRSHHSTLIFVNNRRLAERVSAALNDEAGEELVRAHHGSVAREQRLQMEEELKAGKLPAIVATSSLELGIDMGAIDLVIQIESPPTIAGALQRIGRAGHQKDIASKGIFFPKYRGDLLACAALTKQMLEGSVEEMFYPRNPLDVLAQQIVAMVSMDSWTIDELERVIRRAAPFAELSRSLLESVLDMLSGLYPSDEFAELRPRITWDRTTGTLIAREGAKRIAIANAGTIPDRGLYHVYLLGSDPGKGRVGELDEEMVFETRIGETFLLGSTTWRVEEIKQDRVTVSPAPGQPGKMPFWRGDAPGRSMEFGGAIGQLIRNMQDMAPFDAMQFLQKQHKLSETAARKLLAYLQEQKEKAGEIPDDETIVVERYVDELGDWRVCVLSLFGARVHAPWTHAIEAAIRTSKDIHVETFWSDDGIVIRFPGTDEPPSIEFMLPDPERVEQFVFDQIGASPLFAARFREASARALLLPRRFPGGRAPLWQQRKRASDLLQITAKFPKFPMLLESYREVLRDDFDMPGLMQLLQQIRSKKIRVAVVDTTSPSPFASSLMFNYVANFIYEGDAPLAERRAQALSVDQTHLRELLGETELRELLDPEIIARFERQLQHLDPSHRIKHPDGLHDLLLRIGDLSTIELQERSASANTVVESLSDLERAGRIVSVEVAGKERWIAAEDAARYRDAVGAAVPSDLPSAFLRPSPDPAPELIRRYARTHGPFLAVDVERRFGLAPEEVLRLLRHEQNAGKLTEGAFRRSKIRTEWCDTAVLRAIRQKSLAKLRQEVEPVEAAVFARFLPAWHQVGKLRKGKAALLEVMRQLQGYAVPASVMESQVLPARIQDYDPRDLDTLLSSGLILWRGVERLGLRDGRIAFYLTEDAGRLLLGSEEQPLSGDLHAAIRQFLASAGASFFPQIVAASGAKFRQEVLEALWDLVWTGKVTNDTLLPLRALLKSRRDRSRKSKSSAVPLEAGGRWSLIEKMMPLQAGTTEFLAAEAKQLLARWGVVNREVVASERVPGSFAAVYLVFRAMEEAGKIRRGYFIAGRGATQFSEAGALERMRSMRELPESVIIHTLAATDPANPYGAALPWPQRQDNFQAGRVAGAQVILVNGDLAAYLSKAEHLLYTFGEDELNAGNVAKALADLVESGQRRALFLTEIDGKPPAESFLAPALLREGFVRYPRGWQKRLTSAQASSLQGLKPLNSDAG